MSKWGLLVILCLLLPLPVFAQVGGAGSGGGSALNSVGEALFTSSGTWTVPSGVSTIVLTGCGAGGPGAGGHSADPGGGGGGGGPAFCISRLPVSVSADTVLTITIPTAPAGGAAGATGTAGGSTTVAGLPMGTLYIPGGRVAGVGTVTNGGAGGPSVVGTGNGATGTGAGASSTIIDSRSSGGDSLFSTGGAAGGGATGPGAGGSSTYISSYGPLPSVAGYAVFGGVASGTKGGGGAGGSSPFGLGGVGGSNAAGGNATGYGAGGGGGAPTFAGGNGSPGFLTIQY